MDAKKIAKYFISRDLDTPKNSLKGNMKIQKLLYFSQLISLAKRGIPIFEDNIFAFKDGMVVETVRKEYKKYSGISNISADELDFSAEELSIINTTIDLYGDLDANDLSTLTHEHKTWYEKYHNSIQSTGFVDQALQKVEVEDLIRNELPYISDVLKSYEISNSEEESCIEIDGVSYFYNPDEITSESIKGFALTFTPYEEAYSVFYESGEICVL